MKKYLTAFLLLTFYMESCEHSMNINRDKKKHHIYDSLVYGKINEPYLYHSLINNKDSIVRILVNGYFTNVININIEKKPSSLLIEVKRIPYEYYTPFNLTKLIVEYSYSKYNITNAQWENILTAINKSVGDTGDEKIDGMYINVEFKTKNVYRQTIHWAPFSQNDKNLIELVKALANDSAFQEK